METSITLADTLIIIGKRDLEAALTAIKGAANFQQHRTIGTERADNLIRRAAILEEALTIWGWRLSFIGNGDIYTPEQRGSKENEEEALFLTLDPFIQDNSYAELYDDGGNRWRYTRRELGCIGAQPRHLSGAPGCSGFRRPGGQLLLIARYQSPVRVSRGTLFIVVHLPLWRVFVWEGVPGMAHEKSTAYMPNGLRLVDATPVVSDLVADLQQEMILFVIGPCAGVYLSLYRDGQELSYWRTTQRLSYKQLSALPHQHRTLDYPQDHQGQCETIRTLILDTFFALRAAEEGTPHDLKPLVRFL